MKFAWPALHNQISQMPPVVKAPSRIRRTVHLRLALRARHVLLVLGRSWPPYCWACPLGAIRTRVHAHGEADDAAEVTIASLLALAFVMNYCGATATLGLAFAATGVLFPFFSALLGWIGVFTRSDTAANALFETCK